MQVFKCKMCGGDLELTDGINIVECGYCGTKQTIPTADDEKKVNLFNRANRLRTSGEFDKAAAIYESIVAEFPEEAEAYWGLILCKYGIEYVDDPITSKKIPTCHRSSFESVMEDSDFEQVMENSDVLSRMIYREEAKQIEKLRKGIIEVSNKEEPYDIFICYKETDVNGERTIDSVIAQEVYDALTERGYKVFFSRVTLEDKLGQEYEPYIFAALNSAKIMIAFGTDYEYYNAVWVKNEWSRFLHLISRGEKKTLIPCYKNIDAYDMPKEFAKLQAQDMGKIGAIQDLLRGIEKILPLNNISNSISQYNMSDFGKNLIKANFYLEDGNFRKAYEQFEGLLNVDPTNSNIHLGIALCEFRVKTIEELKNRCINIDSSNSFKRALNYAKEDNKHLLQAYDEIKRRYEIKKIVDALIKYIPIKKAHEENEQIQNKRQYLDNIDEINVAYDKYENILYSEGEYIFAIDENKNVIIDGGGCECNRNKFHEEIHEKIKEVTKLNNISQLAISNNFDDDYVVIGLKTNGTIVTLKADGHHLYRINNTEDHRSDANKWTDIISVVASDFTILGLKSNGTVLACGSNNQGACDVGLWTNIAKIYASTCSSYGIKNDGTVVNSTKDPYEKYDLSDWHNVKSLNIEPLIGLTYNGDVLIPNNIPEEGEWKADYDDFEIDSIRKWNNITKISSGRAYIVGLKNNGTVVSIHGKEYPDINDIISEWSNIVDVITCGNAVIGLKSNGTIVVEGDHKISIDEIMKFQNIVHIHGFFGSVIGIKADGTVVYTSTFGENYYCGAKFDLFNDLHNWKLFSDINEYWKKREDKTYHFANGSTYLGMWKDGKIHGEGIYIFPNDDKMSGEFANGKFRTGEISYHYKNYFFDGHLENGKKSGFGKISWNSGGLWEGIFKDGEPWDGTGTWHFNDCIYDGEIKCGQKNGDGIIRWNNGDEWKGEFKNDEPYNGEGTWHYSNSIKSGKWKNGRKKLF